MSIRPLEITFKLDGTGFYYDAFEPPHLDAILAYLLAPYHVQTTAIGRDDVPDDIPLPLATWTINGLTGWRASALFPIGGNVEALMFWRKRFRQNRVEKSTGSPNLTNATYRDYNTPLPLCLCTEVKAWAVGDRGRVRQVLKRLHWLGKKSSMGRGHIIGLEVEHCTNDYSCVRNGLAQRWLPFAEGTRFVRVKPPYWNNHNRVACCEVQQAYNPGESNEQTRKEEAKI